MKRLVMLLLAVLFLSGCGGTVLPTDWCYRYDFTDSSYSAVMYSGSYTHGVGFSPDNNTGLLDMLIDSDLDVTPEQVIFQVSRGSANQVPIEVVVEVYAFGLWSGQRRTTVPASATTADLSLFPGNGSGTGRTFYLYGRSSQTVFLQSMIVLGNGSNPFGEDNCSDTVGVPPPTPNSLTLPEVEMNDALDDASTDLQDANIPLSSPDGSPLVPAADTGKMVFGYAKWLTAPTTAQELMGPFAPIYYHVGYFITADMVLVGIYFVVFGAVYIIRWVIWIYRSVLEIISSIGGIGLVGGIILLLLFGLLFLGWMIQQLGIPEWILNLLGG